MAKSKYLGMEFSGGWKVEMCERTQDNHLRFYLTKLTYDGLLKTVTLRDNELTALVRGKKTMATLLYGKELQKEHFKNNILRNSVFYRFE